MIEKYNLIHLKTVKSTNIEIKKLFLLNKKISNLCLSADNQTAGYGRRNTKWFSYPGNLHLSILLKPIDSIKSLLQFFIFAFICYSVRFEFFSCSSNIFSRYSYHYCIFWNVFGHNCVSPNLCIFAHNYWS